ncbi:hypothetical protein [Spirosoma sp.]|uniref:hypothetical protein n=1 Tax=Spirosoma sp. TaxID=1899569 RepID=UPI003B3BB004
MKAYLLCCLLLAIGRYVYTPDRTNGQTVSINGQAYQVASRSPLTDQTDYLVVRTRSGLLEKAFLKSESGYVATIFSESELKAFLRNGDLASLGQLVDLTGNKSPFQCVRKGETNVLVHKTGQRVYFIEYGGSISNLIGESKTSAMASPQQTCEEKCLARARACMAVGKNRVEYCTRKYVECLRTCGGNSVNVADYSIAL